MKKLLLATALTAAFATSAFAADEMKKEFAPASSATANPANAPVAAKAAPAASDKLDDKAPSAGKITYTLKDGTTKVDVDNGTAWVNGKPAPEGIHYTQDGKTLTVGKAGKVESVK